MSNYIKPYGKRPPVGPPGIRNLPINLQRTSLVTRQPKVAGQAAEDYYSVMSGARPKPIMLPQSMQFGHWNKQNDGINRGHTTPWERSPMGLLAALRQSGTARAPRVIGPAPISPIHHTAAKRGAAMLPQPSMPPQQTPVSRRWPGYSTPVTSAPPEAFVQAAQRSGLSARQRANDKLFKASGEAARQMQAIRDIFGG